MSAHLSSLKPKIADLGARVPPRLWGLLAMAAVLWWIFAPERPQTLTYTPIESVAPIGSSITGPAEILNGDMLRIQGALVRMWGVDALEPNQTCMQDGGRSGDCAAVAGQVLARAIGHSPVTCTIARVDPWKRGVGRCELADGTDLGAVLLHAGYAMATTEGAAVYQENERAAREARAGAWQGFFMPPWQVRGADQPD